jgi:hypothetical protein
MRAPLWLFPRSTLGIGRPGDSTRVEKGGLLSAKFNYPHWGSTLALGEWPSSATREGPRSSLGGQATGYSADGRQL